MDRFNGFLRESTKKTADITVEPATETAVQAKCQTWKPVTLRRSFLLAVLTITLGLLALAQVLVVHDQRHNGILFAPTINQLGAGYVFLYRYLPTILSVTYGLLWHWIDLDTRRVEPYRQLSKPGGASGSNSLHLHYPTDLLAFVPLKALKRKHWSVVISSSTLVLVGMGLTPLQAAMFATETVTKTFTEPMQLSTQRMSIEDQAAQVTANYTYSASNILWLDERLPHFMTREAAFMPFRPVDAGASQHNESWSATTTTFGMDVRCEEAIFNQTGKTWDSPQGCRLSDPFGPDGNDVIGGSDATEVKEYTPFFAGNQNHDGLADYYLGPYCPERASNIFMVALAKNRRSMSDAPGPVTRLFCETSYHEQDLTATFRRADGKVLNTSDAGPKVPLRPGTFNTSLFEWQINSATQQNAVRSAIPSTKWPDQSPQLAKLPISFPTSYIKMTHIVGLAIGAYPRPMEDYMNPQVLAASYQAAHRLLFARAMVDVLTDDHEAVNTVGGVRTYQTQAVRIIPRFAYAVESVLGIVALMVIALMIVSWGNCLNLLRDPDSMSALMMLVKGQRGVLEQYAPHDQSSWKDLKAETCESSYELTLSGDERECKLELQAHHDKAGITENRRTTPNHKSIEYPIEFSLAVGSIFTFGLVVILTATSYLYQSGIGTGLSLPFQNLSVRQILENYIPTIIATLIEPVWMVLNRLLCLLQPFEELRSTDATRQRSIELNYSSLPPQFTLFKALRARHTVLAAVCAMALLANVLAVAFGGMFNEEIMSVAHAIDSTRLYETRFRTGLENATRSGPSPYYAAMANFTSETPMPPWTDDTAFYVPFSLPKGLNESDYLQVDNVTSIGIKVDCEPLNHRRGYSWSLESDSFDGNVLPIANLAFNLPNNGSGTLSCSPASLNIGTSHYPMPCSDQTLALEILTPLTSKDNRAESEQDSCQHLIAGIWARKSALSLCGNESITITGDDAMAMVCRPNVFSQLVNITVTGEGILHDVRRPEDHVASPDTSGELIREAMRALSEPFGARGAFSSDDWDGIWHNDSFPSNWQTYVMNMMDPDSLILDSESPVPDFDQTAKVFSKAYQKVFAIWLGVNHEALLVPANAKESTVASTLLLPEIRIKVSRAMMILSSTILALYIVVAVAVYARRPGKYLPRMPLTMASDIAMFAATTAIREMEDTSDTLSPQPGDNTRLRNANVRFGYGTFIGTDGKPHVGIERTPFVVALS